MSVAGIKDGPRIAQSAKVQPFSQEAEKSLLGHLLLKESYWEDISSALIREDFYDKKHGVIYDAVAELVKRGKTIDMVTVTEHLISTEQLEAVGGSDYVYALANNAPYIANIKEHIDIIRDKALLRQLLHITTEITQTVYHPEGREAQLLVDMAESKIFAINEARTSDEGVENIIDILARTTEKIDLMSRTDGDLSGTSTGYKDLDDLTAGLHEGDLFIVAGRPSMGKTMFSANIAEFVAVSTKLPVLFFSLEMPSDAIVMRMLSSLGRIPQERIRTGKLNEDDWPRLSSAISMLSETQIFIDDTPGLSPAQMRSRTRKVCRKYGDIGLIVVDYLQLMRVPELRDNRVQEISEISRSLKALAKEFRCTLIALSQLNRSLENRQDRRPMMSDLRESGAIEQDADIIAFVYRDEVYNPDSPDKGSAEIIIGKQRNGPIGTVRLTFMGEFMRFDNYANEFVIQ